MTGPDDSRSEDLQRAYELHIQVVEGSTSVEALCRAHPELARDLRSIDRHYRYAERALAQGDDELPDAIGAEEARRAVAATLEKLRPSRDGDSYRIEDTIFVGGMGEILRVRDERLGRVVAMKRLPRAIGESPTSGPGSHRVLRFLAEAQIAARLAHPAILDVHDAGVDSEGRPYFTMPLVSGRTLSEVIDEVHGPGEEWQLPRALGVVERVCEAMAYAHAQGVVHRDLKPSNILVGDYGETYVVDWGLAKVRSEAASGTSPDTRSASGEESKGGPGAVHTLDGAVLGTPAYMSPEQAKGLVEEVGPHSDVYSVGAILYRLVTGTRPYGVDREPEQVLERVRKGPPAPVESCVPGLPVELVAIVSKAMARRPTERYPDMEALGRDLRAYLEGRVVRAHRTGAWIELRKWMGRHRAIVGLSGLLLAVLVGASATFGFLYKAASAQRRVAQRQLAFLRQTPAGHRIDLGGIPSLGSFVEDFRDGSLDDPLRIWSGPSDFRLVDGHLAVLRADPSSGERPSFGLDDGQAVIRGDFTLSVSFDAGERAQPASPAGQFGVVLRRARDGVLVAFQEFLWGGGAPARIEGHAMSDWARQSEEHPESAGTLRLEREGSRVSGRVWRDGWQELFGSQESAEALQFFVYFYDIDGDPPLRITELSFEALGELEPAPVEPFLLTFDEPDVPYFLTTGPGGVSGVFEGRHFLETFSDSADGVHMKLDRSRCALRGDFAVSLVFEFEDWNRESPRPTALSLEIHEQGHVPESIAALAVTPDDLRTRAHSPRGGVEAFAERESLRTGRLRISRSGSSVVLEQWNAGWQTLLTVDEPRPEVGLGIGLTNRAVPGGATVTIDDLFIEGLHARW